MSVDQRHGTIPTIPQVSKPVDVTDAAEFPEIAAAIQWARPNRAIDEHRIKGGDRG